MILGVVGTGKTSACSIPTSSTAAVACQRSGAQARRVILEVKGDRISRSSLAARGVVYEVWKPHSSIVEGVVVFLSLFDDSPAVHRAFCPPRSAYVEGPKPRQPTPLAPRESLMESGHVLALNFPVWLNPGLTRILGVMLKLDFQRAILQRIPQITAQPNRTWRDPVRVR